MALRHRRQRREGSWVVKHQPPEFASKVLDALSSHIAVLDAAGVTIGVNDAGRPKHDVQENHLAPLDREAGADPDPAIASVGHALRTGLRRHSGVFARRGPFLRGSADRSTVRRALHAAAFVWVLGTTGAMTSACGSGGGGTGGDAALPPDVEEPVAQEPGPPVSVQPIEHVITYGQSVAAGGASLPLVSTVQPHDSLMFVGGVRTLYSSTVRSAIHTSLVPLVEAVDGAGGETPTAGALEMVNDLRFDEDGVSYTQSPERYLGSDPAWGGLPLADLTYGSIAFFGLTEDIHFGAMRAEELGSPYRVGAVTWAQGEADYLIGTTREAYVAGMKALKDWINVYSTAYSGDAALVPIIQHQVSSHIAFGATYPRIALAQTDLAQTTAGFYVATPSYMMDYSDGVHLTGPSSKWLGAYYGLAYKRVIVDKVDWKPLSPTQVTASGSTIQAKFHVPRPPLVLDTTSVSDPGNFGFSVVTSTGTEIEISSVLVTSNDTVTIVTRDPVPSEAKLRYAFIGGGYSGRLSGPRGNLRDSQGDTLIFDPGGINKRMDNWCVIFESAIADLEQ